MNFGLSEQVSLKPHAQWQGFVGGMYIRLYNLLAFNSPISDTDMCWLDSTDRQIWVFFKYVYILFSRN